MLRKAHIFGELKCGEAVPCNMTIHYIESHSVLKKPCGVTFGEGEVVIDRWLHRSASIARVLANQVQINYPKIVSEGFGDSSENF